MTLPAFLGSSVLLAPRHPWHPRSGAEGGAFAFGGSGAGGGAFAFGGPAGVGVLPAGVGVDLVCWVLGGGAVGGAGRFRKNRIADAPKFMPFLTVR